MNPNDLHVHTVRCPECGRYWTGEFLLPLPEKAPCRDCITADPKLGKDHPDVHINPGRLGK